MRSCDPRPPTEPKTRAEGEGRAEREAPIHRNANGPAFLGGAELGARRGASYAAGT